MKKILLILLTAVILFSGYRIFKFPLRDRGFARGYKDVADQTGAVLIPDIFKDIMGNRKLMSDPIHPNGDGYKIMAERFLEAMLP